MADGLCSGDQADDVVIIEKTLIRKKLMAACCNGDGDGAGVPQMSPFYRLGSCSGAGGGDDDDDNKLFDKLCEKKSRGRGDGGDDDVTEDGLLDDDCRKKRCVDRYDSSESSDSGVAVLSCTDCSGSSTASSDIADPGSPFSTASSHSEDSGSQPSTKMPPTQTAHHSPWPWTTEECSSINKRSIQIEKTAFPKRLKSNEDTTTSKQSPPCLSTSTTSSLSSNKLLGNNNNKAASTENVPSPNTVAKNKTSNNNNNNINNNNAKKTAEQTAAKQGKITEYFKSQIKLHVIKKETVKPKYVSLVDQQTQFNGIRPQQRVGTAKSKSETSTKTRKPSQHHHVTVPRKILPAPSKLPDTPPTVTLNHHHHHPHPHHMNNLAGFTPTVTLTAVGFPPNLTYLHTKTPKPPDNGSIFVPQFATITNDKISTIPIINRTPCLNVIHQPVQKITSINNFNCVKLNATVVPIVKLNTLPSRLNGAATLSVETAVPTVLSAKPKSAATATTTSDSVTASATATTPKQQQQQQQGGIVATVAEAAVKCCRIETTEARRPPPPLPEEEMSSRTSTDEQSPSPAAADSDSGVSFKDNLEVAVTAETLTTATAATVPAQKSPILSQPKTIRFPPAKQEIKDEVKDTKTTHSQESGLCRWAECTAQFDTSGALLEHLQIKHVISQASQEQYVCLWLGCKVHGRTSCSRSWLERHVLAHAGTKPFRCIVDGCGQRFNSQLTLERHVNGHFTSDGGQNGSAKKSTESSSAKLFKRNGKKIRFRRQPWSARMFDFIDSGIMEGLQHKLLTMTQDRTSGQLHNAGNTVNVLSQVLARRVEPDGRVKFLVKWHPVDIIPDEWVSEKEYVASKTVSIPSLQPEAKNALNSHFFPPERKIAERRRKPITKRQT